MKKRNEGSAVTEAAPAAPPLRYVVQRRFKYGEAMLEPGTEFVPGQGKHDAQLVAGLGGFVGLEDARVSTRAARQRVRKEGQDGH